MSSASGDTIQTFGQAKVNIAINSLKRIFPWTFIVASVTNPILGYDFLTQYDLVVDCRNNTLRDSTTNQIAHITLNTSQVMSVKVKTPTIPSDVELIFKQYPSLTSPHQNKKSPPTTFYHHIDTQSSSPVFSKPRKLSEDKLKTAKESFKKLQQDGIISQSKSPWCSPLHLVSKSDGGNRYVGDYRALNTITVPDRYPIPNMNNISSKLHNKTVFSKIDLVQAFHQIPVHPNDIQKTAITTPFGLFEYNYMPFGLRNASNTFQRFMDHIFQDLSCVFTYIDDILVFSDNNESHLKDLAKVFSKLDEYNLKISMSKCIFKVPEIEFLGCVICADGIKPSKVKLNELENFPYPNDSKALRRFLGMVGFYRPLVSNFTNIVLPLSERIRLEPNSKSFELCSTEKDAFHNIINVLVNLPPLAHPISQTTQYQLVTDSSQYAVGAALHQMVNNQPIPIGFFSKKLSQSQQKYSAFDRELLAAYYSVLHFKHQIEGRDVLLLSDHKPLCSAFKCRTAAKSDRQQRHLSLLSEYISDITYIKGSQNIVADCLSRPCNNITLDICDLPALAVQQRDDVEMSGYKGDLKSYQLDKDLFILCDTKLPYPRPFVPLNSRKLIFNDFHNLAHSGTKATLKLVKCRYFWPDMDRDIRNWCRECLSCQEAKVHRHTKPSIEPFSLPSPRFQTVHIDIIGPLPIVKNLNDPYFSPFKYVLTMIDRTTRWIETSPLSDISASTVAHAFLNCWISRFGVPLHVVTDRGTQFESELFSELSKITGFHRLRTTSYHPQTNGLVERMHRTLKTAIMARKESWLTALPIVLLALRNTPNESSYAPFTAVTGSALMLPKLLISNEKENADSFTNSDINKLIKEMSLIDIDKLASGKIHSSSSKCYVPKELNSCEYVWLRTDRVRRALEAPYTGPYRVLRRTSKHFTIQLMPDKTSVVSIERLKPAVMSKLNSNEDIINETNTSVNEEISANSDINPSVADGASVSQSETEADSPLESADIRDTIVKTRSGRRVNFKKKDSYHYY